MKSKKIIFFLLLEIFSFFVIFYYLENLKYSTLTLIFGNLIIFYFSINKQPPKKLKTGVEYGSAKWATKDEMKVLKATKDDNNIILTESESLMINERANEPKNDRNKNILVVGGSGSGKTRFFVKPNILQLHSSYIITDPKGTLVLEMGEFLKNNGYDLKIFNTINLEKSFKYNPFVYIKTQFDILTLVETIIQNTKGDGEKSGEDFWVKAEKLLYLALISLIFYDPKIKKEEKNIGTLLDMINSFNIDENDTTKKDDMDFYFEAYENSYNKERFLDKNREKEIKSQLKNLLEDDYLVEYQYQKIKLQNYKNLQYKSDFPLRQFKKYKLAAGKTAKSILISCAARLGVFEVDSLRNLMSKDELELDKIGGYKDENGNIIKLKTALFLNISDTNKTLNFLVAIMFTQLFNMLCQKADDVFNGKLPVHVRFLIDEFANIGKIPDFEQLIATIRSRMISASVILQTQSQLKAIYKDNMDTIIGNCDTMLFLGSQEKGTIKDLSEILGKETIDVITNSKSFSQSNSSSTNFNKLGKDLLSVNEILTMDGNKCILRVRGFNPCFSNKYNLLNHKRIDQTVDGKKNVKIFDLEKYIKNYKKIADLKINKNLLENDKDLKNELKKDPRLIYFLSEKKQKEIFDIGVYEYIQNKKEVKNGNI